MTSSRGESYVWVWLPGAEEPVPVGAVQQQPGSLRFHYGNRYLERADAIALYTPELPLADRWIEPAPELEAAGCLLDAAPDSWGRRIILNRLLGRDSHDADVTTLTFLSEAGSNRIGALDFQPSPREYVPRGSQEVDVDLLARAARLIQAGEPIPPELDQALRAGSSVGGARPKALLRDGDRQLIAKFSSLTDEYPIVRGEFLAMRMAQRCGLDVAPVELSTADGRDVLLVERFDRVPGSRQRRIQLSALTMLGLPEHAPREASYAALSELVRERFADPRETRRELFARIVFNILCGNTDDHARNHAAFWDGSLLTLTPAYDICPYLRGGGEATQAMQIGGRGDPFRYSQVAGCIQRAGLYGLSGDQAAWIVHEQLETIDRDWELVCDEARMTAVERGQFRRVFPHSYALQGL